MKRLAAEKARANADMAERYANLHMPDDIRQRAKTWGDGSMGNRPLEQCISGWLPRGYAGRSDGGHR